MIAIPAPGMLVAGHDGAFVCSMPGKMPGFLGEGTETHWTLRGCEKGMVVSILPSNVSTKVCVLWALDGRTGWIWQQDVDVLR